MIVDELIAMLGYDISGTEKLSRWKQSLDQAASTARTFGTVLAGTAAVAGGALVGAFSAMAPGIIQTSASFEQLEIQLKSLLGTQEAADDATKWIRNFAQTTTLSTTQAAQAFVQLKNFGIDPMSGALQAAADQAAKAGGGFERVQGITLAMGQAWAKGKLQGEEILQMVERGVPVWDLLSKSMGKSVAEVGELSSKGKIGRDEMQKLFELMRENAAGASEAMSTSFSGIMDRFGDVYEDFQLRVGKAGFFDSIKEQAETLLATFRQWDEQGHIQRAAEITSDLFTNIANVIGVVVGRIITHITWLFGALDQIEPYFTHLAVIMGIAVAAFAPWMTAIGLLALALDDLFAYFQGGESLTGDFLKAIEGWEPILIAAAAAIGVLLVAIFPVQAAVLLAIAAVADFVSWLSGGPSVIGAFIDWIDRLWQSFYESSGLESAVEGIKAAWTGLGEWLSGLWSTISDAFTSAWTGLGEWFSGLWSGLVSSITSAWDGVASFFTGIVDTIKSAFSAGGWSGIGSLVATTLLDGFASAWSAVANAMASMWSGLAHTIWDIVSGIFNAIVGFDWLGLVTGIKDAIVGVVDAIVNFDWAGLVASINEAIKNAFLAYVRFLYEFFVTARDLVMSVDWVGLVASIIGALAAAFMGYVDFLSGFWSEVGNRAIAFFTNLGARIGQTLRNAVGGAFDWAARQLGIAEEKASQIGAPSGPTASSPAASTPSSSTPSTTAPVPQPVAPVAPNLKASDLLRSEAMDKLKVGMENFRGNAAKVEGAATNVVNTDNSQDNRAFPVTVNSQINMNVSQPTEAPAAVARAVSGAVNQGVQAAPARMQSGPST